MTKKELLARFGGSLQWAPQRRPLLIPQRQSVQVLVIALESLRLTQRGGNGQPCHLFAPDHPVASRLASSPSLTVR